MIYNLHVIITHKSFDAPILKDIQFYGDTLDDILDGMETLPKHRVNLKKHGRTAFKDKRGVKHEWTLKKIECNS